MLSRVIFETLVNVGEVLECLQEPTHASGYLKYRDRVLKAYADLLRVQWEMDTPPGSDGTSTQIAAMSDIELLERRARLLRFRSPELLEAFKDPD